MAAPEAGWDVIGETHDRLGESPLWHPVEKALYWIDFYGPRIHRLDPATRAYRTWKLDAAPTIGSVAFADDGRLVVALEDRICLFDMTDGSLTHFADPNGGRPALGYNDAKVDRDGRYWVGTWEMTEKWPRAMFYRLDQRGAWEVGDSGFAVCNGPAFSPAGDRLYFSDSSGGRLLVYDLDRGSGRLSVPRVLVESASGADGLCVDGAGDVYCAQYGAGRVTRFGPEGEVREILALPVRNVTACCLGGLSLDTLYVTTAEDGGRSGLDGALFARRVSTPGLPEPLFSPRPRKAGE